MSRLRKFDLEKKLKYCKKCDTLKSFKEFNYSSNSASGLDTYCKICWRDYQNNRNARPEVKNKLRDKWRSKTYRDKVNRKRRTVEGRKRRNIEEKSRYKKDLSYDMTRRIRRLLSHQLSGYSGKFRYLDYTSIDLKRHLEALFKFEMTWDNRCKWHIDHVIPLKYKKQDGSYYWNQEELVDPTTETFKKAWALDNLQPLWASDNLKKLNTHIG